MDIASSHDLEYDLSVLKVLVKDPLESHTLLESMSRFTVMGTILILACNLTYMKAFFDSRVSFLTLLNRSEH